MEIEDKEAKPDKIRDNNVSSSSYRASMNSENIRSSLDKLQKRIIVPLDGSDFSFRAAEYVTNIAKLTGGEIICVHAVVDLSYVEYTGPGILTVPRYIDEAKKQTEEWFPK